MNVLTHRGLDPSKKNFYKESTFGAFADQLQRGFGIEFDINFTKNNRIIVFHDESLERVTEGRDRRIFLKMNLKEIKKVDLGGDKICELDELLNLIAKFRSKVSALHLKGKFQKDRFLKILLAYLKGWQGLMKNLLIFDVNPSTAKVLKKNSWGLMLSPSVAHDYDIKRYNKFVGGTLLSVKEALANKDLFDWVWLDEWDRKAARNKDKKFYTKENFAIFRSVGYRIALVTPELHGTSPGLLGREVHQDSVTTNKLVKRIKEIILLQPNLICTDYPDLVRNLL